MARPRTVSDTAILAATAQAVGAYGPGEVTLAQIGARAGLSAAALLQRFGSKRHLLLALARHGAETFPARLRAARDAEQPVEALIETLAGLAGGVHDPAEFAHHLAFLLLDLSDPDFRAVIHEYTAGVEAAIAEVLHTAGRPDPGLPRAVHAAYNGALITWGMAGGGPPGPAETVRTQLRRALRTD